MIDKLRLKYEQYKEKAPERRAAELERLKHKAEVEELRAKIRVAQEKGKPKPKKQKPKKEESLFGDVDKIFGGSIK